MISSMREKYLEALKTCDGWVIVSEWALRFGELYPDLLEKANIEAANQANDTTGLREIAARISSIISQGGYEDKIEIDTSERPRKIRFIPEGQRSQHECQEIEEDVAPLQRNEIIRLANLVMGNRDQYRVSEFEAISKQLRIFFALDFEVDHSKALLNKLEPGNHHPDNFQLILKAHNAKKNNDNWERFTIDEQISYIETAIKLQGIVASRFNIEMEQQILGSLLERLKAVY
ncbi:hypothetical protein [Zhongshania aliphaticivorans]|uniref:hypothetical protein n=1 Tax=Zhongshania aliphaticivorans TaxID=1470434 RepID=UPI0012E57F27|nr:hypothetical protein [Zhongshania aliphaticivorans]CAA0112789.1 Uncharacterised protein [Zhongshania aliphaticivorans]